MKAKPLAGESAAEIGFVGHNIRAVEVDRWRNGVMVHEIDQVAEEVPVAMVYNGISHAVMQATPASLEALGLGFSLSEGILHNRNELYETKVVQRKDGIELQMTIAEQCFTALQQRHGNLVAQSNGGLANLQQTKYSLDGVKSDQRFSPEMLPAVLSDLPQIQSLRMLTGGTHAAAWGRGDGTIAYVEEDVSRHNALDKLIGTLATKGENFSNGFAIVTSRACYEMVQKTATVGIPMLVAVSAPTGLAIDLAEQSGLTLVGFARDGGYVIYAHSHRLIDHQAQP